MKARRWPRFASQRSYLEIEHAAWQTTLLVTIGSRQKSLVIPGGYVVWSEAWPEAERSADAGEALTKFLQAREQLAR